MEYVIFYRLRYYVILEDEDGCGVDFEKENNSKQIPGGKTNCFYKKKTK